LEDLTLQGAHSTVLLDVSRIVWRKAKGLLPTGIDRTCISYINHFQNRGLAVIQDRKSVRVLSPSLSARILPKLLEPAPSFQLDVIKFLAESLFTPFKPSCRGSIYLNVGHTGLDRPAHAAWLRRTGVKPIYFVHDLIPLTHPEYCRPGEPEKHLRRMTALLRHGTAIVANSRETLNELAVFAGLQHGLDMPPGLVAPLGVGHGPQAAGLPARFTLPARPYFVMVGTIEGRKNHLLMLNVWAQMARQRGVRCPQLVIIGQRGWESEQAVDMLERCDAIRGHVIELSGCDDARLAAYVAGARALLFPTFVEGYGLPLVEALAHGTPVIASDLAVFRELAGEIPDYLSPIDGLGWRALIEDYARPDSLSRADQLERMAGWRPPTWGAHFEAVDRWLTQFS
jgi:glycosyltransferase involved in cell wall biosynthesis